MKSPLCILKVSPPVHRRKASTKGLPVAFSRRAGAAVRGKSACTWSRKFMAAATADVVQITAMDTERTKAFMALLRGFWIENYRSPAAGGLSNPQAHRRRGSGTERTATAKPERQGSDKAGGFAEGLARSCKRIVAGRDGPFRQPGSDPAKPGAGFPFTGPGEPLNSWAGKMRG